MSVFDYWFNVYENGKHGADYFNKSFTDTECYEFGEKFNGKRIYRIHVKKNAHT